LLLFSVVFLMPSASLLAQGTEEPLAVLRSWGPDDVPENVFGPQGIATDRWGNVYVTDHDRDRVWKFDSNGAYLTHWGDTGNGPGEFDWPYAVDVDDSGYVYVVDADNLRVQKFDSVGNYVLEWDIAWGASFPFYAPRGIAVSAYGDVYVTDITYHAVFAFDSQGTPVGHWGDEGSLPGQFLEPHGIDVAPSGDVYVADTLNRRIQVFDGSGGYLWSWSDGEPGINIGDLYDLAVDQFNNVYFMDGNGDVLRKFGPGGGLLSELHEFRQSRGVAVFGYGTVYGVDQQRNMVKKCGYPPAFSSIADIGGDQGRWVRLTWTPTLFDVTTMPTAVTAYGVYRRIDERVMESWDFIATVPARGDTIYNLVAPTLCDSTATGGVCWSVFAVTAFTSYGEFFDSAPDSGYSIDDIPPPLLGAPLVEEIMGELELQVTWDASGAPDLGHYAVYRGGAPDFVPSDPFTPYAESYDPSYVDGAVAPGETWYYRVAAFDDAGNFSGYSSAAGATVTTSTPSAVPWTLRLVGNTPNPFNPRTTIIFELPAAATVDLRVHDLTGRVVRTLAAGDAYGPGRHELVWDGTDAAGRDAASGVYVCRLVAVGETRNGHMVLVR